MKIKVITDFTGWFCLTVEVSEKDVMVFHKSPVYQQSIYGSIWCWWPNKLQLHVCDGAGEVLSVHVWTSEFPDETLQFPEEQDVSCSSRVAILQLSWSRRLRPVWPNCHAPLTANHMLGSGWLLFALSACRTWFHKASLSILKFFTYWTLVCSNSEDT